MEPWRIPSWDWDRGAVAPHNPSSLPCSEGVLLEELDNVNTLSNVMAMYSDNMNNQRKAGLTEGHNQRQPSWAGGVKSRDTDTQFNPYFNPTEAEPFVVVLCV